MEFVRSCIENLPSKMNKAIEDAEKKIIIEDENESEISGCDSFGDDWDSEDISSDNDIYEQG